MSNGKIRLGIVGAGNVTVTHYGPRFNALDGVELAGVVNRTRESSEQAARELGIPTVYDDWTELMEDPNIDAVHIGTWPYMHSTLAVEALDHDKHVLTQARMASSAAEAREMLDASLRNPHLVAQVVPGSMLPRNYMTSLSEMVAGGDIGDVLSVDFTVRKGFADAGVDMAWREDRDLSGFNILMLAARYESLMRVLGPATSVTAMTRVFNPLLGDGDGGTRPTTVPDHVEAIAELAGGGVMHIVISAVAGLAPLSELWVFGSEGTVKVLCDRPIDPNENEPAWIWMARKGDDELSPVSVADGLAGKYEVEKEFVAAIRGEGPVGDTTFPDGLRYMEFTEAVTRSAQEGKAIGLPI